MTYRVVRAVILVVAVGLTPLMVFAASMPPVSSLAPDFTLTSQEGTPVSLGVVCTFQIQNCLSSLARQGSGMHRLNC